MKQKTLDEDMDVSALKILRSRYKKEYLTPYYTIRIPTQEKQTTSDKEE